MNAHNEQQGFTAADMADQAATAFERGRESVLAERNVISAGDAVFAFASMLTSLPHVVPFGASAWATPGADLAGAFNRANGLGVSVDFPAGLVFPKMEGGLLETVRQASQPAATQEAVAWMTHHDEPMLYPTFAEAAAYCDDGEPPIPLYAAPVAAAPGIDLEQFRKLSRDMRKFIDNWDTISIDEFAYFSMRLDEMIDASPKGERVSNSDELAFAARRRRLE